ncbi:MAG: ABC transporter permease [Candidatus Sumerlaea chitinivorans]|nr:ABC transporter permease [Candidatus Sumerlaea chitinivorans]
MTVHVHAGNREVETSPVLLLVRAMLLEAIRRREFYALLLLMGLFLIGAILVQVVGIENPATGTFVLNLGMTLAFGLGHVMALLTAIRALPDEIENRTIYPLLAKPITRLQLFVGKWLAATLAGAVTTFVLFLMGWVPVPKLETYDPVMLAQALMLQFVSLGMISALGLFFSLFLPKAVNLIVLLLLCFPGSKLVNMLTARMGRVIGRDTANWLFGYIPDFQLLNLVTAYTDGLPALSPTQFFLRLFYGAVIIATALTVGTTLFVRRNV